MRVIAFAIYALLATVMVGSITDVRASELTYRNLEVTVVKGGKASYFAGTFLNDSNSTMLDATTVVEILRDGRVVDTRVVRAPRLESGESFRVFSEVPTGANGFRVVKENIAAAK